PSDLVDEAKPRRDLLRRSFALDAHRADPNFHQRPAARENLQHVPYRRPTRTGDQGHPLPKSRQGFLPVRGEVAQAKELLAQLPQGPFQGPDSFGVQLLAVELILPARRINAEPAADNDLHALTRLKAQPQRDAAPDDRAQLRLGILESQVEVP